MVTLWLTLHPISVKCFDVIWWMSLHNIIQWNQVVVTSWQLKVSTCLMRWCNWVVSSADMSSNPCMLSVISLVTHANRWPEGSVAYHILYIQHNKQHRCNLHCPFNSANITSNLKRGQETISTSTYIYI